MDLKTQRWRVVDADTLSGSSPLSLPLWRWMLPVSWLALLWYIIILWDIISIIFTLLFFACLYLIILFIYCNLLLLYFMYLFYHYYVLYIIIITTALYLVIIQFVITVLYLMICSNYCARMNTCIQFHNVSIAVKSLKRFKLVSYFNSCFTSRIKQDTPYISLLLFQLSLFHMYLLNDSAIILAICVSLYLYFINNFSPPVSL